MPLGEVQYHRNVPDLMIAAAGQRPVSSCAAGRTGGGAAFTVFLKGNLDLVGNVRPCLKALMVCALRTPTSSII
jgi:hypothetical protein